MQSVSVSFKSIIIWTTGGLDHEYLRGMVTMYALCMYRHVMYVPEVFISYKLEHVLM